MSSLRTAVLFTGVLSLALAAVAPVAAQPRGARDRARAALREGRFQDALDLFRSAAERGSDPSLWLDVGDAADRLRQDGVALDAYERYLAARADASDRVEVEARVAVLRAVLAPDTQTTTEEREGFIPAVTILEALAQTVPAEAPVGLGRRLSRP